MPVLARNNAIAVRLDSPNQDGREGLGKRVAAGDAALKEARQKLLPRSGQLHFVHCCRLAQA